MFGEFYTLKELIIPDSGDGNFVLGKKKTTEVVKELIIPDSGDGNYEL